jgi:hypothetical protein
MELESEYETLEELESLQGFAMEAVRTIAYGVTEECSDQGEISPDVETIDELLEEDVQEEQGDLEEERGWRKEDRMPPPTEYDNG